MAIPKPLLPGLALPAIAAPMFLTSGPDLVVEACKSGVIGTFPALNQRSTAGLGDWIDEINGRLDDTDAAFGVNLIIHKSNTRLDADLKIVVARKVPLVITSLGAVPEVVEAVQSYGGVVFHDVINLRHARKAVQAGVDGIIAVCTGAGGHGGTLSPFALIPEIRAEFDGAILLSGAISTGAQIVAARAMGADMAYLGTRFLATREAIVNPAHKQMVVEASASDIVYTSVVSGVNANFLQSSLQAAGLAPEAGSKPLDMEQEAAAWRDVWSAGQGAGSVNDLPGTAELCDRLKAEYRKALANLATDPFRTGKETPV